MLMHKERPSAQMTARRYEIVVRDATKVLFVLKVHVLLSAIRQIQNILIMTTMARTRLA